MNKDQRFLMWSLLLAGGIFGCSWQPVTGPGTPDQSVVEKPQAKDANANPSSTKLNPKDAPGNPPTVDTGKDPHFANSIGMEFVLVPAGTFKMGAPESEDNMSFSAKPSHDVKISKAFYLGIYEVTVGEFREFVRDAKYQTDAEKVGGYGFNQNTSKFESGKQYNWSNPGWQLPKGYDNHPVVNVSWNDAKTFCDWLSKKEGKRYRLPTEAEWEYSCPRKIFDALCSGDQEDGLKRYANIADVSFKLKYPDCIPTPMTWDDGYPFTAPVGMFKPNDFGLFDMHGNVWEWCSDTYDSNYYQNRPKPDVDPQGPPEKADYPCVFRGGSFDNGATESRSAFRNAFRRSFRAYSVGFRVVLVR